MFSFLGGCVIVSTGADPFGDEAWFLQVNRRILSGENLYNEVFLGTTPLSAYVSSLFARLFGVQALLLRWLVVACLVIQIYLLIRIVRRFGQGTQLPFLLILAALVYGRPQAGSLYSPLAFVFLLASFERLLAWRSHVRAHQLRSDPIRSRAIITAGVYAGFCFVTKQNVGLLALAALLIAVAIVAAESGFDRPSLARAIVEASGGAIGTISLVLLPVFVQGALPELLDYGFLGKGAYLELASVPYHDGLVRLLHGLTDGPAGLVTAAKHFVYVLPLFTLLALLAMLVGGSDRAMAGIVLCFVGAAFLSATPRSNLTTLLYVTPGMLPGLGYVWGRANQSLRTRLIRTVEVTAGVWLILGLAYLLARPIVQLAGDIYGPSPLPHFRGTLARHALVATIEAEASTLRARAEPRTFLLAGGRSPTLYLMSGLENPTPFDLPLAPAFGRSGQQRVIRGLETGQFDVCYRPEESTLAPSRLEDFVRRQLKPLKDVGGCTLFSSGGRSAGS